MRAPDAAVVVHGRGSDSDGVASARGDGNRDEARAMLTLTGRSRNFTSDFSDGRDEWRRILAEVVGTFLLTLTAAGGPVIQSVTGQPLGHAALVIAPALMVMAVIYSLGDVSGAHLNPAVTMAFAIRKDFPWTRVPGYWVAQLFGATMAALLLRSLFGDLAHLGATLPNHGDGASLVMELVLTAILVTVILGTSTAHRIVGHNAALAVGGTIALLGLFASPISGASMNPARSFGPALASLDFTGYWVYVVGPVCGALIAVVLARLFHGHATPAERSAAVGSAHHAREAARSHAGASEPASPSPFGVR